ncbi:uncharacterized protein LOC144634014 [Oculina patagonica]
MERLDGLVLGHIVSFLDPEDIVRLGRTCRHMHALMPQVKLTTETWNGPDFHIFGPRGGHWKPELYFDGPKLSSMVKELQLSVAWQDQGWGNRKGEIYMMLMRPVQNGEPEEIAKYPRLFGIAEHYEKEAHTVIAADHPVVAKAKARDFYRFMRNAGGGGGHQLKAKNFRVKATVCTVVFDSIPSSTLGE